MEVKGIEIANAKLRRSQIANACLTLAMTLAAGAVHSGAGWGDSKGPSGADVRVPTFYAHSPSGYRDATPMDANGNPDARRNNNYTGKALRKFVDALPGVGTKTMLADGTEKVIPQAQASKWVKPSGDASTDDYIEIAVIQYKEKLHSDLVKPTTLRGYVQIDQYATNGLPAPNGWISKQVKLTYDGTANPILVQKVDGNGLLQWNNDGTPNLVQAIAVDNPHYLGPAIVATKGTATRVKFYNLLPTGRYDSALGVGGDLFVPVDETLPGAGVGPDGVTRYTQNRALIHLHGGDTPWISDGTPHQWITPASERQNLTSEMQSAGSTVKPDEYLRGASASNVPDMNDPGAGAVTYYFPNLQSGRMMWYHDHSLGLTRLNVYVGQAAPYMLVDKVQEDLLKAIPNFPDAKSTLALVIQDKTFVPDDIALQDARWNVGVDGKKFDGVEAKPIWGQPGDLWYPHVYEVNQDPNNGEDGTNPVGRWDWGPYFWPVFPSLYNLPSGAVGDVTLTPEAWMDTPMVNGVAYPTLTVDPKPYRFKILNAGNDRFWNLSMFVADTQVSTISVTDGGAGYDAASTTVTLVNKPNAGGSGATAQAVVVGGKITAIRVTSAGSGYTKAPNIFIVDANGNKTASAEATLAVNTEVKMVPAVPATASGMAACQVDPNGVDIAPPYAPPCWPSNWPTDGRDGGVPDPSTAGPMFYQIGNEGGLLPQVAEIAAAPVQFEYNRRSVTVLNTLSNGLYLGNAERADVLVDFSKFAGQTLIVYNDAPAPVPAFDPRNDHWTGKPDESTAGSVETPRAGFGPNTRTVMQIKVSDGSPSTPLSVVDLKAKLPAIYGSTQERPVVAQEQYNTAFGAAWSNAPQGDGTKAFATIFTGSLQEPAFKFTPGVANGNFKIKVDQGGSGYTTPPVVTITSTDAVAPTVVATAKAALRISAVTVTNGGWGYLYSPTITFTNTSIGSGAAAVAWLKVNSAKGLIGTGNYQLSTGAKSFKLMFSEPQSSGYDAVGTPLTGAASAAWKAANTAYGTATVGATGAITAFTLDFAGHGYNRSPLLSPVPLDANNQSIAPAAGTTYGYATPPAVDCSIDTIMLTSNDPNHPEYAGGVGYDNLANVTVNISAPTGTQPKTATTSITGAVTDITLVNAGQGYVNAPNVQIAPPAVGTTALATAALGGSSVLVKNKAIQELFDPTYGRMNATLGIEIPFTSALTQTTIPLGYVDPITEEFNDGETQIWKITHNGVDAHPVHFHLLNVQLINRVGWDGTVKKPNANEYGWKETIKMNPLEDILVAVRAKKPQLAGFGLPNSKRRRDPSQPANVPTGFTQIDVTTGNPAPVVNADDVDYGWEYVWHCHILGHEENDFMRPVKFNANEVIPTAPTNVVSGPLENNQVAISWTDTSSTEYQFRIERTALDAFSNKLAIVNNTPVYALANSQSYLDTVPALPANTASLQYRVVAVGANGENGAAAAPGLVVPAPTGVASSLGATGAITVSWNGTVSNQVNQYLVQYSLNGGAFTDLTTQAKTNGVNTYVFTPATVTAGDGYILRVTALNVGATTTASSPIVTQVPVVYNAPGAASTVVTSVGANGVVALSWTAPAGTVTNYLVQPLLNGQPVGAATTVTTTSTTFAPSNVAAGQVYAFQITTQRVIGASTLQSAVASSGNVSYGGPTAVAAAGSTTSLSASTGAITVSWAGAANATQYSVQPLLNGVATGAASIVANPSTVFSPAAVSAGDTYTFVVTAQEVINGTTLSSLSTVLNGSAVYAAPVAPAGFTATLPAGSGTTFNLGWTTSASATGYSIQPYLNGVANGAPKVVGASTSTTMAVAATAGTWTFQIVAQRAFGSVGTVSSGVSSSTATVFAMPGAPVLNGALLAVASNGMNSTATVKWNAPSPVAVPGLSGYTVAITDANGAASSCTTSGTVTTCGVTVPRYKGVLNATGGVGMLLLLSNNQVPVSGTVPATGTAVVYQRGNGTGITGLNNGSTYYVINVDATHIKLASSINNANNGAALNISGGSNTNGFGFGGPNSFTASVTATNAVGTGATLATVAAVTAP